MTFSSSFGRAFSPTFHPKSQAAAGSVLVLHDEFTDTDNTVIGDHIPAPVNTPNNRWVAVSGNWGILGNIAGCTNSDSGDYRRMTYDVGLSNIQFEVSFSGYYNGEVPYRSLGMIVRYTDMNNCWFIRRYSNTMFQIVEISGGVWTVRATKDVSLPNRTWHTFTGTVSGTNITAYANGTNMISYSSASSNQSATKIALMLREGTYLDKYDNVKIWTI